MPYSLGMIRALSMAIVLGALFFVIVGRRFANWLRSKLGRKPPRN